MTTDATIGKARDTLNSSWYGFMADRNLSTAFPDWRTDTAGDGTPLLSGRVSGRGAAHAVAQFIRLGKIGLPVDGDTRPSIDYDTPGRVAYVWRFYGVWVELWHPDGAVQDVVDVPPSSVPETPAPAPVKAAEPVLSAPVPRRSLISRASGRLPYTRRNKTPKETTTR
ncbi:MAG: hypothetical protein HOY79_04400 [Streptomyces sp.]|nr:hypothetical protein [Streptomyces sp.]NUS15446.1 hypothetical protein [Streptomyces sp.]NUS24096.1 hypothetical protein [Streptomyces sp.]